MALRGIQNRRGKNEKGLAVCLGNLLVATASLAQSVPGTINYQGRLMDSAGNPVTGMSVPVEFSLYNSDAGGARLWSETKLVEVESGLFSVVLGDSVTMVPSVFNGSTVFMELVVGGDTMTPRQRLTSVPYAFKAGGLADDSITSAMIRDGEVTGDDIGLLTITGANVANGSINSDQIEDHSLGADDIQDIYVLVDGDTVLGDLQCASDLVVDGVAEFRGDWILANQFRDLYNWNYYLDPASLWSGRLYGYLSIGYGGNGDNDYLFFDADDEYIEWDDDDGLFFFSDDVTVSGDVAVTGGDVFDDSGDLRLSAEDNLSIIMDSNNDDADLRSIVFGKNSMSAPAELMRISETGYVGVGTPSPEARLHLYLGEGGGQNPFPTYDPLALESDGWEYINLITTSSSGAGIMFSDDMRNSGMIRYDHAADSMSFYTQTQPRLTIDSIGNATLVGGTTTGRMIIGPAQSSSGSDSELYLAEDDDGTFGISLKYDGGDNNLYFYGKSSSNVYGPHMSIRRDNGYVGVGTGAPETTLHVFGGSGGGSNPVPATDVLTVENDGDNMINIISGSNSLGGIVFSDNFRSPGYIGYDHATNGLSFSVSGSDAMVIGYAGNVGISEVVGGAKLGVVTDTNLYAVYGSNSHTLFSRYGVYGRAEMNTTENVSGYGVYGYALCNGSSGSTADGYGGYFTAYADDNAWGVVGRATSDTGTAYGVYASTGGGATRYAGYFSGNVTVSGTLSKGAGSFKIDHPLDPENKYLYHSFVESPDMKNIYDGVAVLDETGRAEVVLPEWFEALNKDFRYQLTPIGAAGPGLYVAEEIADNRFAISGGDPGMKVSWQVTGVRKDAFAEANRIPVEREKSVDEKGTYLHPQAFGKNEKMGLDYKMEKQMQEREKNMEEK